MYACITDYAAVYDDAYRGHRGSHTSFDVDLFSTLLASFCREAGAGTLLDVSGGRGRLAEALGRLGIRAVTTDITAVPDREVIAFDLSRHVEADVARVRQEAERLDSGAPHVTVCLDVLEHIDREHVFAAVRNLAALTARLLVTSISTRPSSRDNLFHASIFPVSTWIRVFQAAGLRVLPASHFAPATRRPESHRATTDLLVDHWRDIDPFVDVHEGEPRYVVFEKTDAAPDWPAVEVEVEALLDVAYRREKRRQFVVPQGTQFVLGLHHIQEFAILRPLLDVLPRHAVQVLLRRHFVDDIHRRAIGGFLARAGVRTHVYERAEDLPWSELAGHIFVAGAESSCATSHIFGLQIAALARLHGCSTWLLQHGIWPRAFPGRIATFGSGHLLNWSGAEERILEQGRHRIGAVDVPWGVLGPGQVRRIGSARYTDQLLPAHPDGLELRLGVERARFGSVVLLALKKFYGRWGQPDVDAVHHAAMRRLVEAHPETLFLVRPHPAKDTDGLFELKRENVRFLDETCCIAADMPLSRIIPLVDKVVTPMSTIALDAAISDKPVIIGDAGQPHMYDHLEAVPVERVSDLLHDPDFLAGAAQRTRLFRGAYGEAVDGRFYERFSGLLGEPAALSGPPDAALATAVSLAAEAEMQWLGAQHARSQAAWHLHAETVQRARTETAERAHAEATERIAKLEAEGAAVSHKAAVSVKEVEVLRNELAKARLALATMRRSRSWRMTAPFRNAAIAVRWLAQRRPGHHNPPSSGV